MIEIAKGGLLHGLDADAAGESEREFCGQLAAAAARGEVRFCGEQRGGPFDTELASERIGSTPVPPQFFGLLVNFSIEAGRIDVDPDGLDDDEHAIFERSALTDYQGEDRDFRGWAAVGVEREGFLRWLDRSKGDGEIEKSSECGAMLNRQQQDGAASGNRTTGKGGRPRHVERDAFVQEVTRRLALDGGYVTLTAFRSYMKAWAEINLSNPPAERTVERWIDQSVPPGIFAG
ncbi:MAG TPA: hypothetical protein VL752_01310 [Acidisoma sp.]|jgi:hypothetical protein|uniref:hypothetical protein n=1 Tax=Acidisoma sp. TaxID=1872115 RepID=UPI002C7CA5A0|nr:hypothetical protein [Acidisoma sp.]HTH99555.1 hypothetical protein [Acidisoma sp.]